MKVLLLEFWTQILRASLASTLVLDSPGLPSKSSEHPGAVRVSNLQMMPYDIVACKFHMQNYTTKLLKIIHKVP